MTAIKIRSVAGNPLSGGLLATQLATFGLRDPAAVALDLTQLLHHAGAVGILLITKLNTHTKALALPLTPHDPAATEVILGNLGNTVIHQRTDRQGLSEITAQTAVADITNLTGMGRPLADDANVDGYFTGVANKVTHWYSPLCRCQNPPHVAGFYRGWASADALKPLVRDSRSVGHMSGFGHYS